MGPERKIKYKDREVTATQLEFDAKVLLLDVVRIEGEYTDKGDPVYQFEAQYIAGIQAPENLKKKAT